MEILRNVKALTFDLFGTILDLEGSLTPFIAKFLKAKGASVSPEIFWHNTVHDSVSNNTRTPY